MATFRKYNFEDENEYELLRSQLEVEPIIAVRVIVTQTEGEYDSLGNILVPPVLAPGYAVDILWEEEPAFIFSDYEVWPFPMGVHVFAGWDTQYAIDYCQRNPTEEYCQIYQASDNQS